MDRYPPHEIGRRDALRLMAAATAGAAFGLPSPVDAARTLAADYLDDPARVLEGFVRAEGDTAQEQVVLWATGSVYAWLPHQGGQHLFDQEVFSVRRFVRTDDGWLRLSREAGVYLDRETGRVLETWYNPFLQKPVRVFHFRNGHATQAFATARQATNPDVQAWRQADAVCFHRSLFVTRPADLKVADYPLYAQSDTQKAVDLTNLFVNASDLANPKLSSLPMVGSSTRLDNWLPWMQMGQRRGWLMTQLRSRKLRSIEELPSQLAAYWREREPGLLAAPLDASQPNDTGWSDFRKAIDDAAGRARP